MRAFMGWMALVSGAAAGGAWACGSNLRACDDGQACVDARSSGGGPSDTLLVEASFPDVDAETSGAEEADGDTDSLESEGNGGACTSGAPPSEKGCITNASGLFVAAAAKGGSDTAGTGSMEQPFATVSHALATQRAATAAIYVCGGSYAEAIVASGAMTLYGGLTCANHVWAYSRASVPVVTGTSPGFTLEVNAAEGAVHVEDMAFRAPDAASSAGESSIAVFVNASAHVEFDRVTMASGAGSTGATGSAGNNWAGGAATMGATATSTVLTAAPACACGSTAGAGGNSGRATNIGSGGNGGPAIAGGAGGDGLGGVYGANTPPSCSDGDDGATALGAAGGKGQDAGGALSATGWDGGTGGAGAPGDVGQGGGGGSGGGGAVSAATSGGGSAGGCGGCGGGGGGPGGAGGSSFALVSVASNVTLDACALTAGAGGAGGSGGMGQAGQSGGSSGAPLAPGCVGGSGGAGGQGGGGGGGAGGNSVAIVFTGTEPAMTNGTTAAAGTGGAPGPAGSGGSPPPSPGSPGIAQPALGF